MCATNLIRPVSACVPVCSSPSLLTTTDTVLAHGSGHVALFLMCPHSTHLLYQQCEGCKCKAAAEQVMNLEYSVSLFLSLALWLGVHMETNLWLLIITAEMAANTGNWHGLSSVPTFLNWWQKQGAHHFYSLFGSFMEIEFSNHEETNQTNLYSCTGG